MRAIRLLPLLLGGWLVPPVHADDAQDLLKRLAQAERQRSFQGTFVYERNGSFSTHRIWHRVENGKVRERMLQLDGSAQELIRADGATQCITGMLAPGVSTMPQASSRTFDFPKLSTWYDIKVAGKSRVAGRSATIVTLTPKDQHRYGTELHLDDASGLPLKSLLLGERGQLLERFQYTDLDPSEPSDAALQPGEDCRPVEGARLKADTQKRGAPVSWRSDWTPPGFELSSASERKDPDSKAMVTSLMYDDGLSRFSVFVEPVSGTVATDIRTQLGPTVAVSRRLTTPKGDNVVTVVGEIPIGTAERIALSMRGDGASSRK